MLNRWMGLVPNASEHGYLVDHMLEFCHWFMVLLFVGWTIFFLYTLVRFNQRRNPRANYHGVKSKASAHLEFSVVLVEAVLLLGFALPLWGKRVTAEQFPNPGDALHLRAVGEQFAWNFHYPGPDGLFGRTDVYLVNANNPLGLDPNDPASQDDVVSKNDLHLVNHKPTVIDVTSKDVIHSLSLHSMRVTQDATPGSKVPMWFRPIKEGTYEIVCAQLCGAGHFGMRAEMTVESQQTWDGWYTSLASMQHPASAPAASPAPGAAPAPGAPAPAAPGPASAAASDAAPAAPAAGAAPQSNPSLPAQPATPGAAPAPSAQRR
jgi:cytochrome c oxidase subunit 2